MDNQYRIINQCLQLLKQSDMPTIRKLRVEIQLIQMKRLLLNDAIPQEVRKGSCSEEVFKALLAQMKGVCDEPNPNERVNELMKRLGGMLTLLGGGQASQ